MEMQRKGTQAACVREFWPSEPASGRFLARHSMQRKMPILSARKIEAGPFSPKVLENALTACLTDLLNSRNMFWKRPMHFPSLLCTQKAAVRIFEILRCRNFFGDWGEAARGVGGCLPPPGTCRRLEGCNSGFFRRAAGAWERFLVTFNFWWACAHR